MLTFQTPKIDELPNYEACLFYKDLSGRYQNCNARFAQLAGFSSHREIQGLNDFDFPWHEQATFFKRVLDYVLEGHLWVNRFQKLVVDNQCRNILISIFPSADPQGQFSGIVGSFVDVADIKPATFVGNEIHLPGYSELTKSERRVFQALLSGKPNDLVGKELNLAKRTVDSYVEIIKQKLNCASKSELIAFAYSSGIAYLIKD